MPTDPESELIAQQMKHTIDLLRFEIESLKAETAHNREMTDLRLGELEACRDDHESRLRALQDGVTSFKVWSGLSNAGTSVLSLIALFRTFFGV